ncbi:hypothetical protein APHAL10511_000140 [Amanita phalloides]|nr:hypothetical protein APHAL10511_000140 [Amanita phalloides]
MNFTGILAAPNVRQITCKAINSCKKRWLHARYYSAQPPHVTQDSAGPRSVINPNSIFSDGSGWDRVFVNLDDYTARSSPSRRDLVHRPGKPSGRKSGRRQAMTASEISAFEDVFDMIFDTALKNERAAIGEMKEKNAIGDMFTRFQLSSKGFRWASEQDELLDRKKEEINLCASDLELLQWAQREVLDTFDSLQLSSQRHTDPQRTTEQDKERSGDNKSGSTDTSYALPIQIYPHLVAYLMRTFRDKYRDPYLALALFDKVRHRSLTSYVFGCSTQVYNESIETRWTWFRDLKGVHDALEEMVVNGVMVDTHTRRLLEVVRREVGERNAWVENVDIQNGEVWNLLLRLDHLIAKSSSRKRRKAPKWDEWKKNPFTDEDGDKWGFNKWSH